MATSTTNYPNAPMAQGDYSAFVAGEALDFAGGAYWAAGVQYDLGFYDVTGASGSATFISGSLSNGDAFTFTGTNLLGFPATVTSIGYQAVASGVYATLDGSLTLASADDSGSGGITHALVTKSGTRVELFGFQDVNSDNGTISKAIVTANYFGSDVGPVTYKGSFTVTTSVDGVGMFHANLGGTLDSISMKFGSHTINLSGLNQPIAELPSSGNIDALLAWALAGNDTVNGSAGNNELSGYDGNDKVYGKSGFDTLSGAAGADVLSGGDGADELRGGAGHDRLVGGAGGDGFVFDDARRNGDSDHITDFDPAEDAIVLDAAAYANLFVGPGQAITTKYFYASASVDDVGAALKSQHILYDTDSGRLYYDRDGSGSKAAMLLAVLDNHAAITADDIRSAL